MLGMQAHAATSAPTGQSGLAATQTGMVPAAATPHAAQLSAGSEDGVDRWPTATATTADTTRTTHGRGTATRPHA
jgi:hypothetical protein